MDLKNMFIGDAREFSTATQDGDGLKLCVALVGEWKGRGLKVTESRLEQMRDNFLAEDRPILFDYDHKCLGGIFGAGDSRAAGWGKTVEIVDGKLVVDVELTASGKAAMEAGEYRYLSTVFQHERIDRLSGKRIKNNWRLHSVAFTNTPYLTELPAIKNTATVGGNQMENLLKALSSETVEEALAAIQELRNDLVKKADEVTALKAKVAEAEIDQAIQQKKLLPAHKALAVKLMSQDRELYEEFVANAQVGDLTKEEKVEPGEGDGMDPFAKVTSFSDLLKDPKLAEKMETEQPQRFDALYQTFMREGK